MLLRDIPPAKVTDKTVIRHKRYTKSRDVTANPEISSKIARRRINPADINTNTNTNINTVATTTVKNASTLTPKKPLWLQGLIVLNHSSALVCYASVAVVLVIYGMTVYAPKSWTQKYSQLQELQKKERQFTFTEEMLKDGLGQSAAKSNSGFVKPNPENQPIFLPDTPTEKIELNRSNQVQPEVVKPSSPVAY